MTTKPWVQSFYSAKQRCSAGGAYEKFGTKFLMTKEDFKFLWMRDRADEMTKPTIDRVDIFGDYVLENCRFIEHMHNCCRRKRNFGWLRYKHCRCCQRVDRPHECFGACSSCYPFQVKTKNKTGSKLSNKEWFDQKFPNIETRDAKEVKSMYLEGKILPHSRASDWERTPHGITIAQKTVNGKLLRTFPSLTEAARVVKTCRKGISRCLKGKVSCYGGFKWEYVKFPPKRSERINAPQGKG